MRTCPDSPAIDPSTAEHLHAAVDRGRLAARRGTVSRQIPALAAVPASKFAMAAASVSGELTRVGDSAEPFCIQSIAKLFALCVLLQHNPEAWTDIGWEPTKAGFGSVAELERNHGHPANPFVNSGAIVVTDRLLSHTGDAVAATIALLREADPAASITADHAVASSEAATAHRNAAIAHVLVEHGRLHNPMDDVLHQYFNLCAITATVQTIAKSALLLADRTEHRDDGRSARLDPESVRRVNAVLLTAGTYGAAGELAYRIGLPAKSGIGGGVLAIMPGRGTVCAWSPPLDQDGNSAGGVAAIDEFARRARWSVF